MASSAGQRPAVQETCILPLREQLPGLPGCLCLVMFTPVPVSSFASHILGKLFWTRPSMSVSFLKRDVQRGTTHPKYEPIRPKSRSDGGRANLFTVSGSSGPGLSGASPDPLHRRRVPGLRGPQEAPRTGGHLSAPTSLFPAGRPGAHFPGLPPSGGQGSTGLWGGVREGAGSQRRDPETLVGPRSPLHPTQDPGAAAGRCPQAHLPWGRPRSRRGQP